MQEPPSSHRYDHRATSGAVGGDANQMQQMYAVQAGQRRGIVVAASCSSDFHCNDAAPYSAEPPRVHQLYLKKYFSCSSILILTRYTANSS